MPKASITDLIVLLSTPYIINKNNFGTLIYSAYLVDVESKQFAWRFFGVLEKPKTAKPFWAFLVYESHLIKCRNSIFKILSTAELRHPKKSEISKKKV